MSNDTAYELLLPRKGIALPTSNAYDVVKLNVSGSCPISHAFGYTESSGALVTASS